MAYQSIIPGTPNATPVDTSFKAQADNAISVVLREIQHSQDLHEVSVCINAIMAIRELQRKQEGPVLGSAAAGPCAAQRVGVPWMPPPAPGPIGEMGCQQGAPSDAPIVQWNGLGFSG